MGFLSVTKIFRFEKQQKYISMGITWYSIYDACSFSLYDVKFLEMFLAADEKIEE